MSFFIPTEIKRDAFLSFFFLLFNVFEEESIEHSSFVFRLSNIYFVSAEIQSFVSVVQNIYLFFFYIVYIRTWRKLCKIVNGSEDETELLADSSAIPEC